MVYDTLSLDLGPGPGLGGGLGGSRPLRPRGGGGAGLGISLGLMSLGWRPRLCLLGFLLSLYLVAFMLISLVSLDGDKGRMARLARGYERIGRTEQLGAPALGLGGRGPGIRASMLIGGPPRRSRLRWCVAQRFRTEPGPLVALTSFPGSGNTWLRYLLQQATGLYTGSVYKDYALLKHGFPAESVTNGSVLVIKTHEWGPVARKPFQRSILLVRDPGAAIMAEFNRQSGGHVGHAGLDKYKRNNDWFDFVQQKAEAWRAMTLDWLLNFSGPQYVLYYEDLVADVATELKGVLRFLQVNVSESAFNCMLHNKEGIYKRKKRNMTFEPFTPPLKQVLDTHKEAVHVAIKNFWSRNQTETFAGTTQDSPSTT